MGPWLVGRPKPITKKRWERINSAKEKEEADKETDAAERTARGARNWVPKPTRRRLRRAEHIRMMEMRYGEK